MRAFEADSLAEPERWCAGLPSVGVRSMTQGERDAVMAITRDMLRSWWGTIGIMVAVVLLPFALVGYRAPDIGPMASIVVSAAAVLGYAASIASLARRGHAVWRARARFVADISDGTVFEFAGTVPVTPGADADQAALVAAGVLKRGVAGSQHIAVLAVSNHVAFRDPRGNWKALGVHVRAVAAAPTYAMRVPVSREFAVSTDSSKELVRRSLNAAERAEIRQYIGQVWRVSPRLLLWLVPYTAIGVMMLLNWMRSHEHRLLGLVGPAVCTFFIARTVRRLVPALKRSTLLSRDLASGQVITVQPRRHFETGVGVVAPLNAAPREFLPHSGVAWTEGGRPASWRDLVN